MTLWFNTANQLCQYANANKYLPKEANIGKRIRGLDCTKHLRRELTSHRRANSFRATFCYLLAPYVVN